MGKQEILDIIRRSRPELEARYGVGRRGHKLDLVTETALKPAIGKRIRAAVESVCSRKADQRRNGPSRPRKPPATQPGAFSVLKD